MRPASLAFSVFLTAAVLQPYMLLASDGQVKQQNDAGLPGWSTFTRGGAVYQFDTDLDDGGAYSVGRFNIQAGHGYSWDRRTSLSAALSYSHDGYSFSTGSGDDVFRTDPWDNIHTISLSAPARIGLTDDWSAFVIPSVRSTGESGADFDDTLTAGVLAGAAYRFGDRLTIGPGIGVISQLEESASVFPVLIIDWKITDKLSLETGRGLAATLGPGLTLKYRLNRQWKLAVGGRYEKLRFRLDSKGEIPGGVGEDSSFPLFFNCTYSFDSKKTISFLGGVEIGGELSAEDRDGNRIAKESSDSGMFAGVTFSMRF